MKRWLWNLFMFAMTYVVTLLLVMASSSSDTARLVVVLSLIGLGAIVLIATQWKLRRTRNEKTPPKRGSRSGAQSKVPQ